MLSTRARVGFAFSLVTLLVPLVACSAAPDAPHALGAPASPKPAPGMEVGSPAARSEGVARPPAQAPQHADHAPVASAGARPLQPKVGQRVELSGAPSSDPDGDALEYRWFMLTVPAGAYATIDSAKSQTASFVPDAPGDYDLALVVSDGTFESAPAELHLHASEPTDAKPNVQVTPRVSTIKVDTTLVLDASATTPAFAGDTLAYHWSVSRAPAAAHVSLTPAAQRDGAIAEIVADLRGDYEVTLVVDETSAADPSSVITSKPVTAAIAVE